MRTILLMIAAILTANLALAQSTQPAATATTAKPGRAAGETITNSIGMKLVYIPAGEFTMGSPATEVHREEDEFLRQVRISKPFFMSATEVTQKQWTRIMETSIAQQRDESDPSSKLFGEGDDHPIYFVSWEEAVDFCKKLSERDRREYRLPTEAEWEYACRAGTNTPFYTGETLTSEQANFNANFTFGNEPKGVYRDKTIPVTSLKPNPWGLYNMHGNVWNWCADWYAPYPNGDAVDPQGPESGDQRVVRGGAWFREPWMCRSAGRYKRPGDGRFNYVGFRVVCAPGPRDKAP